jgi:hypothetical protein
MNKGKVDRMALDMDERLNDKLNNKLNVENLAGSDNIYENNPDTQSNPLKPLYIKN